MSRRADMLSTGPSAASPRTVEMVMQDGTYLTLGMQKIAEETRDERTGKVKTPPRYRTDFGANEHCPRCGGTSGSSGEMVGSAGILSVMRLDHKGLAYWTAAACSCVFGAWRHRSRKDEWGILPGLEYADNLPDVPPGLSAEEWTAMRIYHDTTVQIEVSVDDEDGKVETRHVWGDSYIQTVDRMPDEIRAKLRPKVELWAERRPPIYEPYPDRRAMPEGA